MMDFENQHGVEEEDEEMEEEEEEDEEEEEEGVPVPAPNSSSRALGMGDEGRSSSPLPLSLSFPVAKRAARYRECLKNHAVGIGGHALDGCCEFMPAGPHGSLDALKCAACNCHRNFHRKEADPASSQQIQSPVAYYPPHPQHSIFQFYPYGGSRGGYPQQRPLALPPSSSAAQAQAQDVIMEPGMMKKRHRTKFTAEQKEKMQELAEKVGWRLQRTDEPLIQHFCQESGIKRHVLKVWLHNNKHTLGKLTNPN